MLLDPPRKDVDNQRNATVSNGSSLPAEAPHHLLPRENQRGTGLTTRPVPSGHHSADEAPRVMYPGGLAHSCNAFALFCLTALHGKEAKLSWYVLLICNFEPSLVIPPTESTRGRSHLGPPPTWHPRSPSTSDPNDSMGWPSEPRPQRLGRLRCSQSRARRERERGRILSSHIS